MAETQPAADPKATAALWAAALPYVLPLLKPLALAVFGTLMLGVGVMTGRPVSGDVAAAHIEHSHADMATSAEVAEMRSAVADLTERMDVVLFVVCQSASEQGIQTAECRGQ